MKKAVKIVINGSVQGIFFRAFVKEEAEKRNVKGHVRNLENGNVEAWFEGNSEEVNEMIKLCKGGPKYAQVKEVIVEERPFQGFSEFKILRI